MTTFTKSILFLLGICLILASCLVPVAAHYINTYGDPALIRNVDKNKVHELVQISEFLIYMFFLLRLLFRGRMKYTPHLRSHRNLEKISWAGN